MKECSCKPVALPESGTLELQSDTLVDGEDLNRFLDAGGTITPSGYRMFVNNRKYDFHVALEDVGELGHEPNDWPPDCPDMKCGRCRACYTGEAKR